MTTSVTLGEGSSELDTPFDPLAEQEPWDTYAECRDRTPVAAGDDGSWMLFRYEDVRHALTDPAYGVEMPFRATRRAFGRSMLDVDGDIHTSLRRMVQPPFRARMRSDSLPEHIAVITRRLLDECSHGGVVDLASALAFQLPIRVFCWIMGLPVEDAEWWYTALRPLIGCIDQTGAMMTEVAAERRRIGHYLSEKTTDDGCDRAGLIANITGAISQHDQLTDADLLSNALMLMAAGTETTGLALANLLAALLRFPDSDKMVRDDVRRVGIVVQESLRLDPPLHMIMRITDADEFVGGVAIPAGSVVHLCLASANRDDRYFRDPNAWKPGRKNPPLMTFGRGKHACLGSALALLELEIALRTIYEETVAIRLATHEVPIPTGRAFRGVRHLPVELRRR